MVARTRSARGHELKRGRIRAAGRMIRLRAGRRSSPANASCVRPTFLGAASHPARFKSP